MEEEDEKEKNMNNQKKKRERCRNNDVIITIYVESALRRRQKLHRRCQPKPRRPPTSKSGYNRKAQLLAYTQQLRQSNSQEKPKVQRRWRVKCKIFQMLEPPMNFSPRAPKSAGPALIGASCITAEDLCNSQLQLQVWIRRLFLHIRRWSGHNQTVSEEKTQEKLSQPHRRTNEPNREECKRDCSSYFRRFRCILKELRCTWKCCKG